MPRNLQLIFFIFFLGINIVEAQTIGGSSVYNFLKLPQHSLTGALGGRNVSSFSAEIGLVTENPALLGEINHGQVSANFTYLAPTLTALNAIGGYHSEKLKTSFAVSINHLQYGNLDQTDPAGNVLGTFNPYDQVAQVSASRLYGEKWYYGISIKYIQSRYGAYSSNAIASDIGLAYFDEENLLQVGFSAKNMGTQLKTYAGMGEDLPFDMVIGITKQLEKAPIRFSLTAQRIHQYDLLYNDTLFNIDNFGRSSKSGFINKIMNHFIFATDILIGEKLVVTGGYNFLRRNELRIPNLSSGLTGFSYGINLKLKKLDFYFSRSHYQSSLAHTQTGFGYKFAQKQN